LVFGFSQTDTLITGAEYSMPQPRPVLTVVVRDLVGLDPAVRNIAKTQTIGILNRAGVELRWIDANGSEDPHLRSATKSYVTIVIAKHSPTRRTTLDAMGFAPARTGPYPRAYVFSSVVDAFLNNFAFETESAFAIILAHGIAHELGHLLIPGDAHGDGIMRPNWGYREWMEALQGSLLFVPSQARVLQQSLQSIR
jgi:hypothetical protein